MKESLLKTYLDTQAKLKELKVLESKLKEQILEKLTPLEPVHTDSYEVKVIEIPGSAFKLKDALKELDKRMLNPFITNFTAKRVIIKKIA